MCAHICEVLRQQSTFHFLILTQHRRFAYLGSKIQLAIIILVHLKIVGQFKILECLGLKPISHFTQVACKTGFTFAAGTKFHCATFAKMPSRI
jgi:hypothetical protein